MTKMVHYGVPKWCIMVYRYAPFRKLNNLKLITNRLYPFKLESISIKHKA